MQNASKNIESYLQSDGKWIATIWILREFYYAEGITQEEAIVALKEHLKNIIPVYENNIWVAQERIKGIKELLNWEEWPDGWL